MTGLTREPYRAIDETAAKAKWQCFRYFTLELSYDLSFKDFLKSLSYCRKIGGFKPSDLYGDREQFDRIKKARGIEFAYIGMRIEVCGKMGTIVGGNDCMNLDVVKDGTYYTDNCHPWYKTKYFGPKRQCGCGVMARD